jgi:hypothetical protein
MRDATLGTIAIEQWGYKYCRFHNKHTNHSSDSCNFPHITCMPGIGRCKVPKTHPYYGEGCLLDDMYEEIQRKRKQWEVLGQALDTSSSQCKTDHKETGGTAS